MSENKEEEVVMGTPIIKPKEYNTLNDTIELMNSADYKERFKGEYYQVKIRRDNLEKMLVKYEAKKLDFTPVCSIEVLQDQLYYMNEYIRVLKIRAEIEGIELDNTQTIIDSPENVEEVNNESSI